MSEAARLALLIGGFTLIGISITAGAGLISQWISAHFSVKCKATELWLARKIDSYQRVMNLAADFAIDPNNSKKYLPFVGSLAAARIVASPKVNDLLSDRHDNSLTLNAKRLRNLKPKEELESFLTTKWIDAMESMADAMREDVDQASARPYQDSLAKLVSRRKKSSRALHTDPTRSLSALRLE
jgi:hypothetical protein